MFNFMRFLLAGLVLFSGGAFAKEYSWVLYSNQSVEYSSPSEACQSQGSYHSAGSKSFVGLTFQGNHNGQPLFQCIYNVYDKTGKLYAKDTIYGSALRKGSTCPPGTEYNPLTGECVPVPDQCEAGQTSSFEFLYCYSYDGGDGCSAGTSSGQPGSFCRNSCTYIPDFNPSTTDADCYSYPNGDGTTGPSVFCSVSAKTNGSECSGDYTPDTPNNSCPAGTVAGVVNGKNVCFPSGDGGDNGGGDGGDNGGGDGGDNGGGDGDGDGGDGGDNGGGDGGNNGGGNNGGGNGGDNGGGDGDGDGDGDGTGGTGTVGDGDGEGGEGGTGEGVENCDSGRCDFGDERGDPFGGEVRSFADSLSAAMDGMKNSPLGSSISNIQFPSGGTCPVGSTSINIGFGSMAIDFESHCSLWDQIAPILSAVFLALWAIIAVRVFLSA